MQMQKPYDGHALVDALKKEGIEEGLDVSKKVVVILADFLRSSAQMSTEGLVGKLDDFAVPGINYFEKLAVEKLSELEASLMAVPAEAPAPAAVEAPAAQAAPADEAPKA